MRDLPSHVFAMAQLLRKLPALALRFMDDMWLLLSAGFLCLMG